MARAKNTDADATAEVTPATEEVTFSAKEVAAELGLDPKSFRRWLRSITEDRANKGGRWVFSAETKDELIARYIEAHTKVEPTED